ncbi:MAG: hypothetical protein ABSH56_27815 [Bryobacteraceae bacterium]|jgi:hypothetical protein
MNRYYLLGLVFAAMNPHCLAQGTATAATQPPAPSQAPTQAADPTQSFASPLGLGTGATIAVTQKGTEVTAAIARQLIEPVVNFWQVGFSGTANTNGQAMVYSSHDADAPGLKAKVGLGKSSFVRNRLVFNRTAGEFRLQAWCRDVLGEVDKGLPHPAGIARNLPCKQAVALEETALKASPPVDGKGKIDERTEDVDTLVLDRLAATADNLTQVIRGTICDGLKTNPDFYKFCPDSGKPQKSVEDEHEAYPGLDTYTTEAPSKFQWKVWGSWAPTVTSASYRPVVAGVADLSDKQYWTKLLNNGVGDVALYYGSLAFGAEAGYGQTVQIKNQNICNNTTAGTYTAQQCAMAMVGQPTPTNAWIASTTFQVTPLPVLGKGAGVKTGAQILFSYVAPLSGGHSSEIAVPFYLAPSTSPMSFVIGIQPTWDWNTDPTVGNKFSIAVFVGARPPLMKP